MLPGLAPCVVGGGRSLGSILSGGTNIGNMTDLGGLAAAFDGGTSEPLSTCAANDAVLLTAGYVGKTLTRRIYKVRCFGSNDHGYVKNSNPAATLKLYGKTGSAPANATNGTLLGTLSFTDTANESSLRSINSSDNETLWDHFWVTVESGGSSEKFGFGELQFYEAV